MIYRIFEVMMTVSTWDRVHRVNQKLYWGDFFTGLREPKEAWFWRFKPFSKLKTAFRECWTSMRFIDEIHRWFASSEFVFSKRRFPEENMQWASSKGLMIFLFLRLDILHISGKDEESGIIGPVCHRYLDEKKNSKPTHNSLNQFWNLESIEKLV